MDDPVLPAVERTLQRGHRDLQLRDPLEMLGVRLEWLVAAYVRETLPFPERLCEVPIHRFEDFEQKRIELRCHVKASF